MTTYRGYRRSYHHATIVTVERDGLEEPLRHYVRHSPTGFAWGYGGSGPAELARCILIDHLGRHEHAGNTGESIELGGLSYQDFKRDIVGAWPWEGEPAVDAATGRYAPVWTLTSAEIDAWIAEHPF